MRSRLLIPGQKHLRMATMWVLGAFISYLCATSLFLVFRNAHTARVVFSALVGLIVALLGYTYTKVSTLSRDGTTGCLRRDILEDRVRWLTRKRRPATIAFVDVNGLKSVNDNLGHDQGDELLREVANRLLSRYGRRPGNRTMVVRMGGDEFLVLCERARDPDDFAVELSEVLAQPHSWGSWSIAVAGIARASAGELRLAQSCADLAMYRAKAHYKRTGVAQIVVYNPDQDGIPANFVTISRPPIRTRDLRQQF